MSEKRSKNEHRTSDSNEAQKKWPCKEVEHRALVLGFEVALGRGLSVGV